MEKQYNVMSGKFEATATHTHECRDCGGTIECDYPETWCDAGRGWGGGNSNCDCAVKASMPDRIVGYAEPFCSTVNANRGL